MTTNRTQSVVCALLAASVVAASVVGLSVAAEPALAQQPPPAVERTVPATSAPAVAPAAAPTAGAPTERAMLSLTDIESRLKAQGLRTTEMEVRDRVLKVEARDANNREIDLLVDRRSGEILSRKVEHDHDKRHDRDDEDKD